MSSIEMKTKITICLDFSLHSKIFLNQFLNHFTDCFIKTGAHINAEIILLIVILA